MAPSILIVDDEPQIRSLVRALLARMGFQLFEAGNGLEALQLCQEKSVAVDVLITDVVMPKMDGISLADRMSQIYPAVRVVFMSGKCDAESIEQEVRERKSKFLRKPFEIPEFRTTVAALASTCSS